MTTRRIPSVVTGYEQGQIHYRQGPPRVFFFFFNEAQSLPKKRALFARACFLFDSLSKMIFIG